MDPKHEVARNQSGYLGGLWDSLGSTQSHQEIGRPWLIRLRAVSCAATIGAVEGCGFGESPRERVDSVDETYPVWVHMSNELVL